MVYRQQRCVEEVYRQQRCAGEVYRQWVCCVMEVYRHQESAKKGVYRQKGCVHVVYRQQADTREVSARCIDRKPVVLTGCTDTRRAPCVGCGILFAACR